MISVSADAHYRSPQISRVKLLIGLLWFGVVFTPLLAWGTPASAPTAFSPASPPLPVGDKQLAGVICDQQNKPVADMTVALDWRWSQTQEMTGDHTSGSIFVGTVATNAQGRFVFPHLPVGEYLYSVFPPAHQYVPVQGTLTISQAETQQVLRVVVSTGSLVTGRVVDAQTGRPVAGVFVGAGPVPLGGALSQWAGWQMPSEGQTDAQGRYQVRVTPGKVFVGVGRITNNTLVSRRIREAVQTVSVRAGQTATALDIPMFLIPIIVCVGLAGQPVVNTTFRITPEDMGQAGAYILDDHTDDSGTVVLDRFENGTFSISQNGRYASGSFQWSPGQPLVIKKDGQTLNFPDDVGRVQLTEGSAANITGHVVSEAGEPLPNALVTVCELDPKSRSVLDDHLFRTDASGNYQASLDPHEEYSVDVRADGFNQVVLTQKPLTFVNGQKADLGTVQLTPAEGIVYGRVIGQSGKPMSGVLVAAQGTVTGLSAAMTDAQGRFRIPNVVLGEALHLTLCLHGEVTDSGQALFQSNDTVDFYGIKAGPTEQDFTWHPSS